MSLNDDMVAQRNLQLQDESPALQAFDAAQFEKVETQREIAGNEMQDSEWFNGPTDKSGNANYTETELADIRADIKGGDKKIELTGSDDFLPYLADIQNDFDFVQQFTDDKKKGRPREQGEYSFEYLKPNTRTVQGVDVATGERRLNTANFNVEGVEHHVGIGVGLLRESTNSAVNGPNESGVRGMAHIARSVQLEGGDFNTYKNALDQVHVSDQSMLLGWNAAIRAQGQQDAHDYFTAPQGQSDVEELPESPPQDLNTEDLINEPEWVDSARFLWGIENAGEFSGSDQDLVDWGLNEMSNFNWRILGAKGMDIGPIPISGTSMAYYATQAAVQGPDYAKSLLALIKMYDRVNTDLGIVGRSLGALATDPLTVAGLGAGRLGTEIAVRVAKNKLQKFLIQASTIGAVEGAAFSGGENLARQSVKVSADEQEGISLLEAGAYTGGGLVAGAVLGPAVGSLLSPYAIKHYRAAGRKILDNARATGRPSQMTSQTGSIGDLAGFVPFAKKSATDYPEIEDASSLDSAFDTATNTRFPNNRALKVALQDRVKAAAKKAGINLDDNSGKTLKFLKNMAVKDAKRALESNANSVGWYDRTVSEALDVLSLIHPEIATDPNAKFAFTYALAVTSNGLKVDKNFELAEKAYQGLKATGRMPDDIGIGNAAGAINKSLREFNGWVDEFGVEQMAKIMESNFTVRQLQKAGFNPTGEHMDTVVRGAAILGPKIGNGFFSNLNGRFDQLTMDRWLMRTWGRWTGSLITARPDLVKAKTSELKDVVGQLKSDPDAIKAWKDIGVNLNERSMKKLSLSIAKASQKPANRAVMNESGAEITRPKGNKGKTENATMGSFIRRIGNGLTKDIDGQKEEPTVADRNRIRSVFGPALDEIRADGHTDMTMADLQALIWYPEKRLYDKARSAEDVAEGYADEEAPNYANAAVDLARKAGVDDKQIDEVVANGRTARARSGSGDESAQANESVRSGFTGRERSEFLKRNVYAGGRTRAAGDGKTRLYSGKSGGNDPSLRGVEEVFSPSKKYSILAADSEIPAPTIHKLTSTQENASEFNKNIQESRDKSPFGAAVKVYSPEEYADMQLFQTPDGSSGFAIKPDGEILSVYSSGGGNVYGMLQLAVEQGGTKLTAFDTVLPDIYEMGGFKETGRMSWDDQYMDPDWDKELFGEFNNGEPDVIEMEYKK
tara:strand:+ start:7264 stop:10824 length:3561 start_codon:yes stop_codon:yes gene_type:complete